MVLYQIDAFTNHLYGGNPAAVIPLESWLPEDEMQLIAGENNLSETVFFVPDNSGLADFHIRWFTPAVEINLCGHATLASAWVLFNLLKFPHPVIRFQSKSGILNVSLEEDKIAMDFPSWKPERVNEYQDVLSKILGGIEIVGVYKHRDLLVELTDEAAVLKCNPDFSFMKQYFDKIIITAPGEKVDFVSRFFAPGVGVDEDPVTGSAHSQLIPFWSEKLNKKKLHALQLSKRIGEIWCEQINEERVKMSGYGVYYMKGELMKQYN